VASQLRQADSHAARQGDASQTVNFEQRGEVAIRPSVSVPSGSASQQSSPTPGDTLPSTESEGGERGSDGRAREGLNQTAATAARQTADQPLQPHQLLMNGRPALASPAWNGTLNNHVMWLASQNNKVAEIQLDPPELGSLQVKIRVSQDQVSVSFISPHASVRDAVEQSMARLRDMFEEQGLNLAESSVDDQAAQQHADREGMSDNEVGPGAGLDGEGDDELVAGEAKAHTLSLVDYYA